ARQGADAWQPVESVRVFLTETGSGLTQTRQPLQLTRLGNVTRTTDTPNVTTSDLRASREHGLGAALAAGDRFSVRAVRGMAEKGANRIGHGGREDVLEVTRLLLDLSL